MNSARLVRPLQRACHHLADGRSRRPHPVTGGPQRERVLGRQHDGGTAQVQLAAQVRHEPRDPARVLGGDLVDQAHEAVVAVGGTLVEGVLGHHVHHREQEQFVLGVTGERGRAFMVDRVRARRNGAANRKLGHDCSPGA
jgi:hypothetical protein